MAINFSSLGGSPKGSTENRPSSPENDSDLEAQPGLSLGCLEASSRALGLGTRRSDFKLSRGVRVIGSESS